MWEEGVPSHSESFLHFDVVNGAIWCICPVFSSYSTNLYVILLWKLLFSSFFLFLSPHFFFHFFFFFFLGGGDRPPGYAPVNSYLQVISILYPKNTVY